MNTTFNSLAFYTCNHGYRREGRPSRTCQLSGTWSGVAPRCQGNMFKSVTYIGLPLRRLGGGGGGGGGGGKGREAHCPLARISFLEMCESHVPFQQR